MRYAHYSEYERGRKFITDSELSLTHIVLGQRNKAKDKEALGDVFQKTHTDLSPEEYAALLKFTEYSNRGWYSMKPIAWCGSEEEANAVADKFKVDGWINIEVKEINPQHTITHA